MNHGIPWNRITKPFHWGGKKTDKLDESLQTDQEKIATENGWKNFLWVWKKRSSDTNGTTQEGRYAYSQHGKTRAHFLKTPKIHPFRNHLQYPYFLILSLIVLKNRAHSYQNFKAQSPHFENGEGRSSEKFFDFFEIRKFENFQRLFKIILELDPPKRHIWGYHNSPYNKLWILIFRKSRICITMWRACQSKTVYNVKNPTAPIVVLWGVVQNARGMIWRVGNPIFWECA